jgi:hypothetical protein
VAIALGYAQTRHFGAVRFAFDADIEEPTARDCTVDQLSESVQRMAGTM